MQTFDLKAFLQSIDFADYEVAEMISVAPSTFNQMKNGKTKFQTKHLNKLRTAFPDIDLAQFFKKEISIETYNSNNDELFQLFKMKDKELSECRTENAKLLREIIELKDTIAKEREMTKSGPKTTPKLS